MLSQVEGSCEHLRLPTEYPAGVDSLGTKFILIINRWAESTPRYHHDEHSGAANNVKVHKAVGTTR